MEKEAISNILIYINLSYKRNKENQKFSLQFLSMMLKTSFRQNRLNLSLKINKKIKNKRFREHKKLNSQKIELNKLNNRKKKNLLIQQLWKFYKKKLKKLKLHLKPNLKKENIIWKPNWKHFMVKIKKRNDNDFYTM